MEHQTQLNGMPNRLLSRIDSIKPNGLNIESHQHGKIENSNLLKKKHVNIDSYLNVFTILISDQKLQIITTTKMKFCSMKKANKYNLIERSKKIF